ncbi:hypothetical protein [Gymnodinialimonas sp.]
MRRLVALWVLCLAGGAQADAWEALDGASLVAALTDRTVTYDTGATQHFYASGRTLYTHGEPSWGSWRAENNQYCSNWPPSPTWDCYDVFRGGTAGISFLDEWGNAYPGVIEPE